MAAVSGQRLANLTKEMLKKIRTDQSFDHFYANVARKSEGLLGEPRFQENDALRPDWRLVLVHQAILKLLKITLDGSIMRPLILSSGLSISALIRKASAPKRRWRTCWLKLLMVTIMRQSSFSWASYSEVVKDTGALPGELSILEVMLKEEKISCFDEIPLAVLKFPGPEKKLIQEVQTYL